MHLDNESPWQAPDTAPVDEKAFEPVSLSWRVALVAVAPVLYAGVTAIPMPGLNQAVLAEWLAQSLVFGGGDGLFSIGTLNIVPIITGFILIELLWLARDQGRLDRIGGPVGRRNMGRYAVRLALVLAAIQAWSVCQSMLQMRVGSVPVTTSGFIPAVVTLTVVAVTAMFIGYARMVNERGLGQGFAVLLGVVSLRSLLDWAALLPVWLQADFVPVRLLGMVLIIAATVKGTLWLLHSRPQSRLVQPVAGLVPINWAITWVLMFMTAFPGPSGVPNDRNLGYWMAVGIVVLFLSPASSALFNRFAQATDVRASNQHSALALVALVVMSAVAPWLGPAVPVVTVAMTTAIGLDLVKEYRARRTLGPLVPVWPMHRIYRVRDAEDALQAAEIPCFAQALHTRTMLQILGPFVPIQILVRPEDASRATAILTRLLLPVAKAATSTAALEAT